MMILVLSDLLALMVPRYSFGWESQLLETGFLAVWLGTDAWVWPLFPAPFKPIRRLAGGYTASGAASGASNSAASGAKSRTSDRRWKELQLAGPSVARADAVKAAAERTDSDSGDSGSDSDSGEVESGGDGKCDGKGGGVEAEEAEEAAWASALAPPSRLVVAWGYRWLLFRIMLGAGLIKVMNTHT